VTATVPVGAGARLKHYANRGYAEAAQLYQELDAALQQIPHIVRYIGQEKSTWPMVSWQDIDRGVVPKGLFP